MDIYPGDRAEKCGGMMKPIFIEKGSGGYIIIHKCMLCRQKQRNRVGKEDDFQVLVDISKKVAVGP